MIYDLQRSAHLRWLLDRRCYVHLRWSCFLLLFDMSTTNITFCVDHKAKLQTTQVQKVWKFHWPTEDGKSLLGKKVISLFTVIAQDITNPTISRNTWNNIISRDRPVEESGTSVSRNYHISYASSGQISQEKRWCLTSISCTPSRTCALSWAQNPIIYSGAARGYNLSFARPFVLWSLNATPLSKFFPRTRAPCR